MIIGSLGSLAGVLFAVIIGLAVGLIAAILGLFFGNIILFDSIALAIISGVLCNSFLTIHTAFVLIIGIVVFVLLYLVQRTRFGFWIIGGLLSLLWGFVFSIFAYGFTNGDTVWAYVIWGLGTLFMLILHIRAKTKQY